ncbi:MAG: D-alanyl-D-alanine carboxypeptidase [Hyphomicrobiaceae bacterium]|nr:D-alanyl-D-alanine carboxypeptidase [Hyphomicrobiaceae bacterium]
MFRAAFAAIFAAALTLLTAGRSTAEPLLLFDPAADNVIYAQEADQPWHPASLTKIMTAYVTFEAIKKGQITLETKIPCSAYAHTMPASKLGLPIGAEITVELALKALIVKSANDVAIMLAEAVGGTYEGFIARMNATAKRLGMRRTNFVNANGLPAEAQVTTARDLARLSAAVLRDFPQYNHIWAQPSVKIGRRRLRSHNSLLRTFEGADGLKTGFICDSGFNIVASAERGGRRLIAIVLGATTPQNRAIRAASLLEHGFSMGPWKLFFSSRTALASLPTSATSSSAPSVRGTLPVPSCNPRLVRRRHARRRARIRALRHKRRKDLARRRSQSKPKPKSQSQSQSQSKPAANGANIATSSAPTVKR